MTDAEVEAFDLKNEQGGWNWPTLDVWMTMTAEQRQRLAQRFTDAANDPFYGGPDPAAIAFAYALGTEGVTI